MRLIGSTIFLFCFAISNAHADEDAPRLAVPSDGDAPYYDIAFTTDALSPVWGIYVLELEIALARRHSVRVAPSWSPRTGYAMELGYRLWPFAEGLRDLYFGVSVGFLSTGDDQHSVAGVIAADVGWQFVWQGIAFGLGAGAAGLFPTSDQESSPSLAPRIRLAIGYVWI